MQTSAGQFSDIEDIQMKNRLILVVLVLLFGGYAGGCTITKDYHLIKPISPKDAGWVDGGDRKSVV